MIAIIILNWNGWQDTIECLKSLYASKGNFFILLVDNGSSDDSVVRIIEYLKEEKRIYCCIDEGTKLENIPSDRECIVYKLKENYGFAKGNNMALEMMGDYLPKRCLLLNNDTEVSDNFLIELEMFWCKNPDYKILSPIIYYYYDKNIIWNAGGKIKFRNRKYYYADKTRESIKEDIFIPCTFITGCALLFDTLILDKKRHLFTEKFFHGEEDFDLSLRMLERKIPMACVLNSTIYHKVNRSIQKMDNRGKLYVYFLNRYINLRCHYGPFKYKLWKILFTTALFGYLLMKLHFSVIESLHFCEKLVTESKTKESVTKSDFFTYLNDFNNI